VTGIAFFVPIYGSVIFCGGIISCDGALERCYIVLYWVGWWSKKMIFAL